MLVRFLWLFLAVPAFAHSLPETAPAPSPDESPARREARELAAALSREEHEPHDAASADAWIARNQRLVELYRDLGDRPAQAQALTGLALAHADLGDSARAAAVLEDALALCRGGAAEADVLNWLGYIHIRMGEYQRAFERLQEALPVARANGTPSTLAAVLGNLGALYSLLREERQALRYKKEALALVEHTDDPDRLALIHNIGASYAFVGEPRKALVYLRRARAGWRAIGDRANEALTLAIIGQLYRTLGRTDLSLRALRQALAVVHAVGNRQDEISTLLELGYTYVERHEREEARRQYEAAFAILKSLDRAGHIDAWSSVPTALARLDFQENRLDEARTWAETALAVVESSRLSLSSPGLRTDYSASVERAYKVYVDILMAQHRQSPAGGFDRAALEASERSRARTLLETLTGARVDLDKDVDPALAGSQKALYDKLDAKAELQIRRQLEGQTSAGQALEAEIRQTSAELELLQGQVRARSSSSLAQPLPITATEIQSLLDPDTTLLEYTLGKYRSYLWVVTTDAVRTYTLPPEKEIDRLVRQLHRSMTARDHVPDGLDATARLARLATATRTSALTAARLGEILLGAVPRPKQKRLVIVPDGALHYLPFAALTSPTAWAKPAPLIAGYEIVTLPSAAVLAAQRRELAARPRAPKRLLVLADPVFGAGDPRVANATGFTQGAPSPTVSSLNRFREGLPPAFTLPRLAFSRGLVDEAMSRVASGDADVAVGFDANRTKALSPEMADYQTVIFATHGILNSEYPELSGVVLSLVDPEGKPQKGFLRLHDVYDMKLRAEAVVLAACETGIGKELKGEGLVGLSRGFFYAGTRRVIATLWKVDEEATVEIIRTFLRAVADGEPHAAALRQAQLRVRADPRWSAPYFWAGLTLQGEWR